MSEPAPDVQFRHTPSQDGSTHTSKCQVITQHGNAWRPYDPYLRPPHPVTAAEFGAALLRVNESMTSALAEYESGGAR